MSGDKYIPPYMKNNANRFEALGDSYASKYRANTYEKPSQPKVLSVDSEKDFPSLGGVSKKVTTTTSKFSDMAKCWAKTTEEENKKAQLERERIAREKADLESIRRNMKVIKNLSKKNTNNAEDNELEYDYHESILGEDEDFHIPSEEEPELSEEDEEEYYNPDELEEYQKY
jgi:hypothetical protein